MCPVDESNYMAIYTALGDECWNVLTTQVGEGIDFTDTFLSKQECACILKFGSVEEASEAWGVDVWTCSIDGMNSAGQLWEQCNEYYGGNTEI